MTESQLNKCRIKIAKQVQSKRKELGISQAALAKESGLGIATIKRFESGKLWINLKQYIILRASLKLPDIS